MGFREPWTNKMRALLVRRSLLVLVALALVAVLALPSPWPSGRRGFGRIRRSATGLGM
jgi:hypothetical protein